MPNWEDTSSYSQGDKEREIKSVAIKLGRVRIVVHRNIYSPGKWFLTMHGGWIDARELKAEEIEAAKVEAIGILQKEIATLASALAE